MRSQLTLTFGETLAYSSETFVAHTGVRETAETLVTLAAEQRFALVYIHGLSQTGKTHLSVYCAGLLQSLARSVEVLSPTGVREWLSKGAARKGAPPGSSLFIDDAERWIAQPAAEGGFTAVADGVLQSKGLLVLLSSVPATSVNAPAQVKSRLAAGVQLEMGGPEEHDLDAILRAMSAQRGLKLTEPKRRFILARVPRTVPALTQYMERLCEVGRRASSSTSFEVLAQALGQ
jgi:chromosomal replication initiation ATPase DnaA